MGRQLFGFRKKKGPTLGLDINSDSVSLIELDKTRNGIELVKFATMPTPANTVREGLIADPQAIGSVILELMSQAGVPPGGASPEINMTVPAQSAVIRLMPVPTGMPPDELAEVVTQEATNHVPFPIADANLDWSLMPATERTDPDGVRRVDVILAAIQRTIIDTCWKTADSAGVQLGKVEVSSLSSLRGLALAGYMGSSGHISMVVNIRQDATDINIVRSAMPLFGRSVIIGIETLTEAIARSLEIDFEEALGMLPRIPLFGTPPQNELEGQAAQVARTIFSDITDELERSLDFYQSQVGEVKIDQILLTGPGCMVPNLEQYIESRMGHRTVLGDVMRDMIFDRSLLVDRMRPILASLIGSSLEPSWNPNFTVDLDLNKEGRLPILFDDRTTMKIEETEPLTEWFKPTLVGGIAVLAITAIAALVLSLVWNPIKTGQKTELETKITTANTELKEVTELKESNKLLTTRRKVLNFLVKKSRRWSKYMDMIQTNKPDGVQVDHVIFEPDHFVVEGFALDFTSISRLSLNLSASPLVENAQIDYAKRHEKSPGLVSFSVTAKLNRVKGPGEKSTPRVQPITAIPLHKKTASNLTAPPFSIDGAL